MMEHHFSRLVDPSSYDSQGLCQGIPLRVHRQINLELKGTVRLRQDWVRYVGDPPPTYTNIGPTYNWVSVAIPECRPDRLEVLSYGVELAFLQDDLRDMTSANQRVAFDGQVLESAQDMPDADRSGVGQLFRRFFKDMRSIDPNGAEDFMKNWLRPDYKFRRDQAEFQTFEGYVEYRVADAAGRFMTGLVIFAMGLHIPSDEIEKCCQLTRPVWVSTCLANDVHSWEKELIENQNNSDMANAVGLLMKQKSIDADSAKPLVLEKAKEAVAEYVEIVKNTHQREDLSRDSRTLIEAMQYVISGSLLWSLSTPRYHVNSVFNDEEVAWMRMGWQVMRYLT